MTDQRPFKPGDRVRMKAKFHAINHRQKSFAGTVVAIRVAKYYWDIDENGNMYHPPVSPIGSSVSVRRDGMSKSTSCHFSIHPREETEWELIPLHDLSEDTVAVLLAKAVLAGDINAARPLADRVMEFCGATPRETAT